MQCTPFPYRSSFRLRLTCADLNEVFLQGLVNTLVTIIRHASNQSVPKAAWYSPALWMPQNPTGIGRVCVNGSSNEYHGVFCCGL